METTANKTTATLLQLSAYAQYIFPFGNFILPIVIWSAKKEQSEFVNYNGKQAINFQLSILLYTITLLIIAVPIFIFAFFKDAQINMWDNGHWVLERFNEGHMTSVIIIGIIAAVVAFVLKVAEFFLILLAAIKNSNGENYRFPLTINFIK
ncbi:MAG: DUF4870 domain-containing protein [Bacteroidota bacterium]